MGGCSPDISVENGVTPLMLTNGAQAAGLSPSCSNGGTFQEEGCPSFTLGEMLVGAEQ